MSTYQEERDKAWEYWCRMQNYTPSQTPDDLEKKLDAIIRVAFNAGFSQGWTAGQNLEDV